MPVAAVPPSQDQVRAYNENISALNNALAAPDGDAKPAQVEKAVAALNQQVDQLRGQNVDVAVLLKPEDVAKFEEAKRFGLAPDYVAGLDNFLASGADHTNDAQGVNLSATMRERANAALGINETGGTTAPANLDPELVLLRGSLDAFAPLTAAEKAELDAMKNDPDPAKAAFAKERLALEAQVTTMRAGFAELKQAGSLEDITCYLKGDFEGLSADAKREVMKEVKARNKDLPRDQRVSLEDVVAAHGELLHDKLKGLSAGLAGLAGNSNPMAAAIAAAANAPTADVDKATLVSAVDELRANPDAKGAIGAQLDPKLPAPVRRAVSQLEDSRRDYQKFAERNTDELMALINSNLPIELIICLVLLKIGERQREKLKLKMKELAAAEAMESAKTTRSIFDGVAEKVKEENPSLSGKDLDDAINAAERKIQAEHDKRLESTRESFEVPELQSATQSLQFEQNQLKQFMDAMSNVLRVVQDMAATPIRHIR